MDQEMEMLKEMQELGSQIDDPILKRAAIIVHRLVSDRQNAVAALVEIRAIGKRNPGYGSSCSKRADAALTELGYEC